MTHDTPEPDTELSKLLTAYSKKQLQIMDAALELFANKGYWATTIPEIAEAARCGPATIYRHFDGKEGLVNHVYRRARSRLVAAAYQEWTSELPFKTVFETTCYNVFELARQSPSVLIFLELHHHDEYLDEATRRIDELATQTIFDELERARDARLIKPISDPMIMSLILGSAAHAVKTARRGYIELDEETSTAFILTLWEAIRA